MSASFTSRHQYWGFQIVKSLSRHTFCAWDRNLRTQALTRAAAASVTEFRTQHPVRIMSRAAALSFLAIAMLGMPVHAAPTAPDAADDPAHSESEERRLPDPLRTGNNATGSRTIDLLIDMQQRSAGLQFNERQRPSRPNEVKSTGVLNAASPVAAPQVRSPQASAPLVPPSGLFGSGATPMVQSARTATVEPRSPQGAELVPTRRPGVSSSGEPLPRWLLLPREIIEYVRDNRWLVLSSVGGGLLLIWGVSSLFARAAANAGRVPATRAGRDLSADRWDSSRHEVRPARRRSHRRPG